MKAMVWLCVAVFLLGFNSWGQGQAPNDVTESKVQLKQPKEFQFGGGPLEAFLKAVKESFEIDLEKIGTVPERMRYSVQVPKMRLKGTMRQVPHAPAGTVRTNGIHIAQVLDLYNQVSKDGDSNLGRWIVRLTEDGEPSLIVLVPPRGTSGSEFSVRAFSFQVKTAEQADNLRKVRELIAIERDRLRQVVDEGRQPGLTLADVRGDVNYHSEAGIIVATGGKIFVEMASAIIQAAKDRVEISDIPIPKRTEQKME